MVSCNTSFAGCPSRRGNAQTTRVFHLRPLCHRPSVDQTDNRGEVCALEVRYRRCTTCSMPAGDTLFQRLRACTGVELDALAKILGVGRTADREFDVMALSKALRRAAGDSFVNVVRGDHDFEYREILVDVARKLASTLAWSPAIDTKTREEWLEDYISVAASIVDDPNRSGLSNEAIAEAAERADAALKGEKVEPSPLTAAVGFGAMAVLGFFVFPAFAALGLAGYIQMISAPAMRKTVPAVLVLIHGRRRAEFEKMLSEIPGEAA